MISIITAMYGGCDQLHSQVEQDVDAEWVCFTDDPDLDPPAPWRAEVRRSAYGHPRMAAKVPKMLPTVDGTADVIWLDANMQVTSRSFAREALHARHDGMAVWRHPKRDCIYDEAAASLPLLKYAGLPIAEQVEHYRREGHPEHAGLFACGTIAWDLTQPRCRTLGKAWLVECSRWTVQDQLSLPVVARRLGMTLGTFPVHQTERHPSRRRPYFENRWLRIHPHLSDR